MTNDKDVDELLIMWKTVGEMNLYVEKTLFGLIFAGIFNSVLELCGKNCYFFLSSNQFTIWKRVIVNFQR